MNATKLSSKRWLGMGSLTISLLLGGNLEAQPCSFGLGYAADEFRIRIQNLREIQAMPDLVKGGYFVSLQGTIARIDSQGNPILPAVRLWGGQDYATAHNKIDDEFLVSSRFQSGIVYGQRFTRDGERLGSAIRIGTGGSDLHLRYNPDTNEYFHVEVHWSFRNAFSNIMGKRISSKGVVEEGVVIARPGLDLVRIQDVVYNPVTKEYLVCWRGLSDRRLLARRVSERGRPLGDEILVSHWFPNSSAVAVDPGRGRYLILFTVPNIGVIAQMIDGDGSLIGDEVYLAGQTGQPAVAFNTDSDTYVATWADEPHIWAAIVFADGSVHEEVVPIITDHDRRGVGGSSIASSATSNRLLLVWKATDGIYGRLLAVGTQCPGACCAPEDGCQAGIRDFECPGRFETEVDCAHIDPPCGELCPPRFACDGDVDGDGQVDAVDLGLVEAHFCWNCRTEDICRFDQDCDYRITRDDAEIIQFLMRSCEPARPPCP